MLRTTLLAMFLAAAPAAAFANSCPVLMGDIDQALESASLSEEDMAKVKELRTQGEELHESGDHEGSMQALEEAKSMLGL